MKRLGLGLRPPYMIAFLVLFGVEVFIALFVRDRFIRPYFGDVLVVILLYCMVRSVWCQPTKLLPLWVFLFAACVEVGQYFNLVERLHLEKYTILRIAIGSSFDLADLLCYAVGAGMLFAWQWLEARWHPKS